MLFRSADQNVDPAVVQQARERAVATAVGADDLGEVASQGGPGNHWDPGGSAGAPWGGLGDQSEVQVKPLPLHKALVLSAALHQLDSSSLFDFRLNTVFLGGVFLTPLNLPWQMALLTSSLALLS